MRTTRGVQLVVAMQGVTICASAIRVGEIPRKEQLAHLLQILHADGKDLLSRMMIVWYN